MDVEIVKQDGRTYRLSGYGVVKDFVVSSISRNVVRSAVDGRAGSIDHGVEVGDRTISVPFIFKAFDMHDYAHLRDELYGILDDHEPFYIREMRRPKMLQYDFVDFGQPHQWGEHTEDKYVNGKQILVRMETNLTPEQMTKNGEFTIEFVTCGLPYFESIYTTLELSDSGYASTEEKYGLVDAISSDNHQYRFDANEFTVYNAGNVVIEPENMSIEITVTGLTTGGNFTIRNRTTGDTFVFDRDVSNRTLRINGVSVTENGVNRFRDSNRRFISLAPGDNKFEVSGGKFSQVSLNTKYYYR